MANKNALFSLVCLLKYKLGRVLTQIINFVGKTTPTKYNSNNESVKTSKE